MARAAWEGSKICWFQRSYEAPALLVLLKLIFSEGVDKALLDAQASRIENIDVIWPQFMAYSAAVFNNCGNFRSFGDTKFVPELSKDDFWGIISSSCAFKTHGDVMSNIWEKINYEVYTEKDPHQHIGFPDKNGVTSYYSYNVTSADAELLDKFCQEHKISPLNTRLFKEEDEEGVRYVLRIASAETKSGPQEYQLKDNVTVTVVNQDFADIMRTLTANIEQAKYYTEGDTQRNMLQQYEDHFRYGDVDTHKDSQRFWIKDVGPIVETNIGFIETYLDPSGGRAEFEGFVAIVNKTTSAKFAKLV